MCAHVIIQARMGSTRLPGKVLREILGKPMLGHIIERVSRSPGVKRVIVATSDLPMDEPIRAYCTQLNIPVYAGDERDVLDRFYKSAVNFGSDPIIRITGDCPLADPEVIGRLLALYTAGGYDHIGVAAGAGAMFLEGRHFPDGLDAECFSFAALQQAWREATSPEDREHVTPYIWRNKALFRCGNLWADTDYGQLRCTVDNMEDFEFITRIYTALYQVDKPFLLADVLRYIELNPELAEMNRSFVGQEGYLKVWQLKDSDH